MMWLTWRQHRGTALFTLTGLATLAAFIIPTGLSMHRSFAELGIADCAKAAGDGETVASGFPQHCDAAMGQLSNQYSAMGMAAVLMAFLPVLVGLFWGAPLVAREVERGTHRLVWTQGVSRRRWALVKFGLVGGFGLLVATAYGLGVSWWMAPLSLSGSISRFNSLFFDVQGLVPIGYTLAAIALGILAGAVFRKTLPAMAISVAAFFAARFTMAGFARPNFMSPETQEYPLGAVEQTTNPFRQDWLVASNVHNSEGDIVAANSAIGCKDVESGCGYGAGAYNSNVFHPGDRFWLFQGIEAGIFAAAAVLLLYFAVRRIRRIA